MGPVEQYIDKKLQERKETGKLRKLRSSNAQLDFFSNDYLGIASNKLLGINEPGTGSTGSRLLSGNSLETELLEKRIANFHKAEAALIFNSGYDANTGLLASIANRHSTILYDELCHASIIDGMKLSRSARHYKFRHNNATDLEKKLEQHSGNGPVIVVVESVYSMDGDIAPLVEIASLSERYNASLVVDEAHATGVFGPKGAGLVAELQLEKKIFARVHTFGKALGCHGAAVLGSNRLKEFLVNFARPFIYTTALPPHSIAAIGKAYDYLSDPFFSNKELHELIAYFREKIKASGNTGWKDSTSPIQALVCGNNEHTKKVAQALQDAGLQVNPILHPTVPEGSERLRICLHIFNTKEQVDLLFNILSKTT
jgi:8-amino-7-oxononanoate synthase